MPPKKVSRTEASKAAKAVKSTVREEKSSTSKSKDPGEKLERKTSPNMSVYEYTALIRARALQLGTPGAFPKIEIDPSRPEDFDPTNIATREVRECLVSLIIRRTLTDGSYEDWHPKDMIFPRI